MIKYHPSSFVFVSVDGQWSEWSDFTECTQTCGFGQQHRTRRCDNPPPQHGGGYCVGTDIDFVEGCNPYPCPSNTLFYSKWIIITVTL